MYIYICTYIYIYIHTYIYIYIYICVCIYIYMYNIYIYIFGPCSMPGEPFWKTPSQLWPCNTDWFEVPTWYKAYVRPQVFDVFSTTQLQESCRRLKILSIYIYNHPIHQYTSMIRGFNWINEKKNGKRYFAIAKLVCWFS